MTRTIDFHAAKGLSGSRADDGESGEQAMLRWKQRERCVPLSLRAGGSMTPLHAISGMSGAVMVLPREGLRKTASSALRSYLLHWRK
jgi:nitrite reductase (NO-forming)